MVAACAGIALFRTLADADRIEAQLQSSPDDVSARLMLLRYYRSLGNNVAAERVKAALREHAVWVIEHHPENPSLREPWVALRPQGGRTADPAAWEAADRAWRKHLAEPSINANTYTNAATFYQYSDRTLRTRSRPTGCMRFQPIPEWARSWAN